MKILFAILSAALLTLQANRGFSQGFSEVQTISPASIPIVQVTFGIHGVVDQTTVYLNSHGVPAIEDANVGQPFSGGVTLFEVERMTVKDSVAAGVLPPLPSTSLGTPAVVPEPSMLSLGIIGGLGLALMLRRRRTILNCATRAAQWLPPAHLRRPKSPRRRGRA